MCGITGWVDFERDLTSERETLAAMTKTMTCRARRLRGFPGPHAARREKSLLRAAAGDFLDLE
jgi:asparagine synthase (glutamine-hydrolysing)